MADAAANVEQSIVGRERQGGGDGILERIEDAAVEQAAAGGDGCGGIAGVFRTAILGLEEVDVADTGQVEGMALGAGEGIAVTGQG